MSSLIAAEDRPPPAERSSGRRVSTARRGRSVDGAYLPRTDRQRYDMTYDKWRPLVIAVIALLALPLGYLVRNRTVAFVAYAVLFSQVYTFQTANLVMEWVNGSDAAFPQEGSTQLLSGTLGYFSFTTLILAVGAVLLVAGGRLRARRDVRGSSALRGTPTADSALQAPPPARPSTRKRS